MDEHDDLSERLRQQAKEDEEKASAVNEILKKPATLKCFVEVTVHASVEVDSEGCSDDGSKEKLLRDAVQEFENSTGIAGDWDNNDLSCTVSADGEPCLRLERTQFQRSFCDPKHPVKISYL